VGVAEGLVVGAEPPGSLFDVPPGAAGFVRIAVGKAQSGALERRRAAETLSRQAVGRAETARVIGGRGKGPLPNVLDGDGPARAAGKADVGAAVSHCAGQIHASKRRPEGAGGGTVVAHSDPKLGAVVSDVDVEDPAGMEVDAASAEIKDVGGRAVDVLADLAEAGVEGKEPGTAVLDADVSQTAAGAAAGCCALRVILNRKGAAVGGVAAGAYPKLVGGGEALDVDLLVPPSAASLIVVAVGQAQGSNVGIRNGSQWRGAAETVEAQTSGRAEQSREVRVARNTRVIIFRREVSENFLSEGDTRRVVPVRNENGAGGRMKIPGGPAILVSIEPGEHAPDPHIGVGVGIPDVRRPLGVGSPFADHDHMAGRRGGDTVVARGVVPTAAGVEVDVVTKVGGAIAQGVAAGDPAEVAGPAVAAGQGHVRRAGPPKGVQQALHTGRVISGAVLGNVAAVAPQGPCVGIGHVLDVRFVVEPEEHRRVVCVARGDVLPKGGAMVV